MPPSLIDRTACPSLELLCCELLTNTAAVADVLVLNRVRFQANIRKSLSEFRIQADIRLQVFAY